MKIIATEKKEEEESVHIEYQLSDKGYNVYFKPIGEETLSCSNEALIAGGILPCLKAGEHELNVDGEISERFISGLSTIQDIFCAWDDSFKRTEIKEAIPIQRTMGNGHNRVATFFSGGVDSFYTLIKHREEITDLIFVHGMDIQLHNSDLRKESSEKIAEIASEFNINAIEIETNIREMLDGYVSWRIFGHGAVLASIGHMLSSKFRRIFIPASYTYAELHPCGTHPVLDHLWSTETLEFIHDGCESTRIGKVSRIAKYDTVLKSLRVCWEKNIDRKYNCGRCEKCIRTMISLKAFGALDKCTTFENQYEIVQLVKKITLSSRSRIFLRDNLKALRATKADQELEEILERMLKKPGVINRIARRIKKGAKRNYS